MKLRIFIFLLFVNFTLGHANWHVLKVEIARDWESEHREYKYLFGHFDPSKPNSVPMELTLHKVGSSNKSERGILKAVNKESLSYKFPIPNDWILAESELELCIKLKQSVQVNKLRSGEIKRIALN